MRIDYNHICLAVDDLKLCSEFYAKIFQARLLKVAAKSLVEFYALPGGLILELFQKIDGQSQFKGHLAFQVDNAEAFFEEIQTKGIECGKPVKRPSGNIIVILHDPSGNEIEVLEHAAGMDPREWLTEPCA